MSELGRRVVHASGTVVPVLYLLDVLGWVHVQYLVALAAFIALVLEGLRLYGTLDLWAYRELTRDYEQSNPAGYALALVGGAITVWVFDPFVAVPALLMLTIADPISGILSGEELSVKGGYVLFVTFGICLAIASLLSVPVLPAIAGAGAATIADGVKPVVAGYVIDDNISIPLGAALAMQVVLLLI